MTKVKTAKSHLVELKWWQKIGLWFKKPHIFVDYNHRKGSIVYVVFKRFGEGMIVINKGTL